MAIQAQVVSTAPVYDAGREANTTMTTDGRLRVSSSMVNADGSAADRLPPGRAAAASSAPVALSNEDKASLDAMLPQSNVRLLSSAATTNATLAKASSGRLFKVIGLNTVASVRYLKLYNKASAPTVGTDTPIMTIAIPASSSFTPDIHGLLFNAGIAFAITGAVADADTTAIGAGDIVGLNLVIN